MTRNNEGRTQIPPELFEQFMKQQEQKFTQQTPEPASTPAPNVNIGGYSVPTDFVDLPSQGRFYPENHPWFNKDRIEVRFMTTKEEDIITSPALAQKGLTFDKLIESISVDRVSAKTILPGDKSAILINCRKNAYGDEYEFDSFCQVCESPYTETIKLSELNNKEINYLDYSITPNKTFIVTAPVSNASVEFKMYDSTDEDYISKQAETRRRHNLPEETVAVTHRRMIQSVNGETSEAVINSFVGSLLLKDSRFLQKSYLAVKPDVDLVHKHSCTVCGHENKGGVPFGASFFWTDI
jgi:hypothetical protein